MSSCQCPADNKVQCCILPCCHTFTAESTKELKMVPTRSATPGVRIKLLWLGMAVPTNKSVDAPCRYQKQIRFVKHSVKHSSTSLWSLIHDWKTLHAKNLWLFASHYVTWPHQKKTSLTSLHIMNHVWLPCDVELDHMRSFGYCTSFWNTRWFPNQLTPKHKSRIVKI